MLRSKRPRPLLFRASLLLLLIGPLLIGFETKAQGNANEEASPTTLTENSFGLLALPPADSVTAERLRALFPEATVEQKTGQQDGPDFTYYRITKDSAHLADVRMDPTTAHIERVIVHSPEVTDTYGVEIGMSYTEIKENRPKIDHATDYHYDTYAYEPNSHLAYEISGEVESRDGPPVDRRDYQEEEIRDWTVKRLLWRRDADEGK